MAIFGYNRNKYGGGSYFKRKGSFYSSLRPTKMRKTNLGLKFYARSKKRNVSYFSWGDGNWYQK